MNVDRTTNGYLDVYYDYEVEGKWQQLGQAFHVKDDYLSKGTPSSNWYPMIRYDDGVFKDNKEALSNDMSLSCEKGDDVVLASERVVNSDRPFFVGKWSFHKLFVGPELGEKELPEEDIVKEWTVHFDRGIVKCSVLMKLVVIIDGRLAFKIGNVISTTVDGLGDPNCKEQVCTGLRIGPLAMTKMMSSEPEREFERLITEGLEKGLSHVSYCDDTLLIQGQALSIELKRKTVQIVITE